MRKSVCILALALVACGQGRSTNNSADASVAAHTTASTPNEQPTVVQLLKAGKPEACAHPDVKQRIADMIATPSNIKPFAPYGNDVMTQQDVEEARAKIQPTTVADYQAIGVDAQIGKVKCSATMSNDSYYPSLHDTLEYEVRPSLEANGEFIVAGRLFGYAQASQTSAVYAGAEKLVHARR